MDLISALAVVIGILGGFLAFLLLQFPIGGVNLQFWAAFLAAASFFSCGGQEAGLQKSLSAILWGVFVCWLTLLLVVKGPTASLGVPVWAGISVAIGTIVLIMGAKIPMFAAIPSTVFGFASTAAFFLLFAKADPLAANLTNPAINVGLSMIIGSIFGYVAEKIAVPLVKPAVVAPARTSEVVR